MSCEHVVNLVAPGTGDVTAPPEEFRVGEVLENLRQQFRRQRANIDCHRDHEFDRTADYVVLVVSVFRSCLGGGVRDPDCRNEESG